MLVRRAVLILALLSMLLGVLPAHSDEPAKTASGASPAEIVLPQCRVKLTDQVTLASDRIGILEFVVPREGAAVEKGKAIAGLRDDVARAALAVAEHEATNDVEVRFAEKSSEVARVEHRKAVETNRRATGAVPEVEILRLKLAAERSILQAEQAKRDFKTSGLNRDQARAELRSYRIEAPFDGIVTRVYRFAGEAVQQGDPIVEVVNPDRMRVEGFINVQDVRAVAPNQRVSVQLELPGETSELSPEVLDGRVVFVDVSVQPVTNKVRIWAEVDNRDRILRAGSTATMVINTRDEPRPTEAVGRKEPRPADSSQARRPKRP